MAELNDGRGSVSKPEPGAGERLRQLINGYQVTQAIQAFVTLGLPQRLAAGPRPVAELAADAAAHPGSLYRLLRALAAVGIVTEADPAARTFELTEMGRLLTPDAPESLAGWVVFVTRPYHWEAWTGLAESIRTGGSAFEASHGESVWEWRERHAEENEVFNHAMHALSSATAARLADRYDFSRFSTVADLGGGDGTLLAAVLASHPHLDGVLVDLPHVVAGAPERTRPGAVSATAAPASIRSPPGPRA